MLPGWRTRFSPSAAGWASMRAQVSCSANAAVRKGSTGIALLRHVLQRLRHPNPIELHDAATGDVPRGGRGELRQRDLLLRVLPVLLRLHQQLLHDRDGCCECLRYNLLGLSVVGDALPLQVTFPHHPRPFVRAPRRAAPVPRTLRNRRLCWLFRSSKSFSSTNVASGTSALLTRRAAASLFRRA